MQVVRLLGAVCVIFATSYSGFQISIKLQKRIAQLEDLKKIFTELYSDVEYGACTLSESFGRIAEHQSQMFQDFLQFLCREMEPDNGKEHGKPFAFIFSEGIRIQLQKSNLSKQDKEELAWLGKQLGSSQRMGQLRLLQLYLQSQDHKIEELEKTRQEKQKVIRILGISSGILIVILLL